jgi:hypothetical protein
LGKHKAEGRRETVLLLLLLLREEEEEEAWCDNKSQLEKRSGMKSVPQAEDTLLAHMMILVGLQWSRKAPVVVVVAVQRALCVCVGEKRRRSKRGKTKEEQNDDSEQVWGSTPTRNR